MSEVASAYVSLIPSLRGAKGMIGKEIVPEAESAGKRAGARMGGALKAGLITAAVGTAAAAVKIVSDSIGAASEAEQAVGGVQAVFGKYADSVLADSKKAASGLGLSAAAYNELVTASGAMLKNKGLKTFAADAKSLIKVGADLSAQYGGSTKEAVEALNSAMRGESDPIERYGISMNAAALKAEAMSLGLVKNVKNLDKIKAAQNTAMLGQRKYTDAVTKHGKGSDQALAAEASMLRSKAALSKALDGEKVELTDAQKAQAALSLVSKQSADAQGAFARESNTLAGQQQRLGATWDNIKVKIGTGLLPSLTSATSVVGQFVSGMQNGTGVGGRFAAVAGAIGSAVAGTVNFLVENKSAVIGLTIATGALVAVTQIHAAVLAVAAAGGMLKYLQGLKLVSAATKVYAAVQWVLNAALTANPIGLIIVGLIALGAGLVIAYKKSTTFRNIVNAAFSMVKKVAAGVVNFFTTSVPAAFNRVRGAAASTLGWVKGNWPKILAVLTGPFGIAALLIYKNWDKIRAGGVMVLTWIKALPGQIKGAFSGAAGWLLSAGTQIIDGLLSGITSKFDSVRSKLGELTKMIPDWKGPAKRDKKLLEPTGQMIMDGLVKGIDGGRKQLKAVLARVTKDIETFKSLRDAVKSAFSPDLFSATPDMFGVGLKQQLGINNAVIAAVKKLKGMKLDPAFLSGLIQSGNFDLITALAGAGTSTVKAQQADWLAVQKTASQLGVQTAEAVTGKKLDGLQAELKRLNKAVSRLAKDTGREVSKGVNKSASDARRNSR